MMQDRNITVISEQELLAELAECISLEGEAKTRAKPLRDELLRRQIETGEITIEHDGWESKLKKEPVTAPWVERHFGFTKDDLPAEVFVETFELKFNAEKAVAWRVEQGFTVGASYTLAVGRKKVTSVKLKADNAG